MTDRPDQPGHDPWSSDPVATNRTAVPRVGDPPRPPASRGERRDDGRTGSIVFGVILVAVGAWFFLEQTVGLDLPDLRWDELWPILLIVIGLWIVLGAMRRER